VNYPKAKGSTRESSGFKPVLINEQAKSFIVDPKVFIIWSLCNGKNTLDDIRVKFEDRLGLDDRKPSDYNVAGVISTLERIGLVQT
jgi:hypothetical protein